MIPGIGLRAVTLFGTALVVLLLAGCANPFSRERLDNWSLTYKINIQQGVVVTQEMADQLKPGMTRDQVRFVLGTPILTDPFHADRWDYPFRFQPGRGRIEERRFTVYFDNDNKMVRYNGDSLPTEEEFAASRNFATTRIVRAPLLGRPLPQLPSRGSDIGGTSVTPGKVDTPDRPSTPVDQTPPSPITNNSEPH
ncbi:MAG: outer membrane protein assembly factor BamE [Burkholderiaceae bacterium]